LEVVDVNVDVITNFLVLVLLVTERPLSAIAHENYGQRGPEGVRFKAVVVWALWDKEDEAGCGDEDEDLVRTRDGEGVDGITAVEEGTK
jgi:hypothetical protein